MKEKRATERIFTARVQVFSRVVIPKVIREELNIKRGDVVEIGIKKIGRVEK